MNPLRYLRPAVYAALTSPAVVLVSGVMVPVRAYGRGTEAAYILLNPDQDTCNSTIDSPRCQQWDCTLLVDVVTLHASGTLSTALADEVADAVADHLHHNRFTLPAGLQLLAAKVESVSGGSGLDGEQVDIHRYLRLRYTVAYNAPAGSPALPTPPVITNFTATAPPAAPSITNFSATAA